MLRINQIDDVQQLRFDPELWREVYGYMCVCLAELKEFADEAEEDEYDLNFHIASEGDVAYVKELGVPEESVRIDICCGPERRQLRRLVFTSEVIFMEETVAHQFLDEDNRLESVRGEV